MMTQSGSCNQIRVWAWLCQSTSHLLGNVYISLQETMTIVILGNN